MTKELFAGTTLIMDLEELKAGQPASFHFLYEQLYPELLAEARVLTTHRQAAIAVCTSCVKAWIRSDQFSSLPMLLGYLHYTVRNQVKKEAGRDHLQTILSRPLPVSTKDEAFAGISSLSPEQIMTVRLVYQAYEKHGTLKKAGDSMRLSAAAIRQNLHLACRIIRFIIPDDVLQPVDCQ